MIRRILLLTVLVSFFSTLSYSQQVSLALGNVEICEDQDTACVPFIIGSSLPIISIEFSTYWDGAGLTFAGIEDYQGPPFGGLALGPATMPLGPLNDTLNVSWTAPDPFNGTTFTAGDTLFLIKFLISGPVGNSYSYNFYDVPGNPNGYPVPPVVGAPGFGFYSPVFTANGGVTVIGNTPVLVNCPSDIVVDNDVGVCGASVSWTPPTVTDCDENSGTPMTISGVAPGDFFNTGSTSVTYTVTDTDGNSASCSFDVTVNDTENPIITCPGNIIESIPTGSAPLNIDGMELQPTSSDNCSVSEVTYSFSGATSGSGTFDPNSSYDFNAGTTTVTLTATDPSNNMADCSFTVEVIESDAEPIGLDIGDVTVTCGDSMVEVPIILQDDVTLVSLAFSTYWDGAGLEYVELINNIGVGMPTIGPNPGPPAVDTLNVSWVSPDPIGGISFNAGDTLFTVKFNVTGAPGSSFFFSFYDIPGNPNTYPAPPEASVPSSPFPVVVPVNTTNGSVTIAPDNPPTITCPGDTSIACGSPTDTTVTGSATATDDCSEPVITFSDMESPGCGNTIVITRTFTATDDAGQTSTCTQTITTIDTIPPVLDPAPADITVDCVAPAAETLNWTDNCNDPGVATVEDVSDGNTCPETITRTWTATDGCGNMSTVSQIIVVQDTTPPVFGSIPVDVTVQCIDDVPTSAPLAWTDDCDGSGTADAADVSDGNTCPETITRTWTHTDSCGNTASVSQTITVEDTIEPEFADVPSALTVECVDEVPDPIEITWTDNCDGTGMVLSSDVSDGNTCPETITRTWTYTDSCGNTGTATQTITVEDTTPAVFDAAPAAVTVECLDDVPDPVALGVNDNCDGSGMVDPIDTQTGTGCPITVTRTWSYTDSCGNESTATQVITVEDTQAPVFDAPPMDVSVQCLDDVPTTAPLTWTDNCDGTGTVDPVDTQSGDVCPITVTRTWTYTDNCGNEATAMQTIIVQDDVAPEFQNVPNDITIQCFEDIPDPVALTWTDNCDGTGTAVSTDGAPSGDNCQGSITRTWTHTDNCGNVATVTQLITVQDTTSPFFIVPDEVTISCLDDPLDLTLTGDVTTESDNCGTISQEATFTDVLEIIDQCESKIVRTWSLTDDCGNVFTAEQTIGIFDDVPPKAQCQNIDIYLDANGQATITADQIDDGSSDECSGDVTLDIALTVFTCTEVGQNQVDLFVVDQCGNMASCAAFVNVIDSIGPSIICPDDVFVNGNMPLAVSDLAPELMDNCESTLMLSYTLSGDTNGGGTGDASGTVFNVGTTTVTYTVEDLSGNIDMCSFDVTIEPATLEITCPADQTVATDQGACTATIVNIGLTVSDQSLVNEILYELTGATIGMGMGDVSGTAFNIGVTTVTYSAVSIFGDTTSCSFTVTVLDNVPPVVSCTGPDTLVADPGVCTATLSGVLIDVMDCQPDTFTYNLVGATNGSGNGDPNGILLNAGTTNISILATDGSGNTGTCVFTVVVVDEEPPTLICPADDTVESDVDACGTNVFDLTPTNLDNCGVPTLTYNLVGATSGSGSGDVSGLFFNVGTTGVAYMTVDDAGNMASCVVNITVEDNVDPVVECPNDITIGAGLGMDSVIVNNISPINVTDNCSIKDTLYEYFGASNGTGSGDASGTAFFIGTTTVTYTVRDSQNNVGQCQFTVTVLDANPPDIECPENVVVSLFDLPCDTTIDNIGVVINEDSTTIDTVTYTLSGATSGMGVDDASGETFNVGTTTVTYTVVNDQDVPNICSFTVTVIDSIPPVVTCPDTINQTADMGVCGLEIAGLQPTVQECSAFTTTFELTGATTGSGPGDTTSLFFNVGTTIMTYTVTDENGNTGTCSFPITVVDGEPPVVNCIGDTTILVDAGFCSATLDTMGLIDATDNCGIVSTIYEYSGATTGGGVGDTSGVTFNVGVTNVLYIVEDEFGNIDSCNFNVSVIDDRAPSFECPNDFTVSADPLTDTAPIFIEPVVNDNCGVVDTSFTLSDATVGSGQGTIDTFFNLGVTTVQYIATDAAGNTTTCTFIVFVDTPPLDIECPSDTTVANDSSLCSRVINNIPLVILDTTTIDTVFYTFSGATVDTGYVNASGSAFNVGTTTVTYGAVADGDTTTCSFFVTVNDVESPEITCPADTVIGIGLDTCAAVAFWELPTVVDNCPDISITSNIEPGDTLPVGTTTVTYVASDAAGNTDACSFVVTIEDSFAPIISCPNNQASVNDPGQCGTVIDSIAPLAVIENCGMASITYVLSVGGVPIDTGMNDASGTFFNVGGTTVTYTATDMSGNESSCSFLVGVSDQEAPMVECPDSVIVSLLPTDSAIQVNNIAPVSATDNCSVADTSYTLSGATMGTGNGDASGELFNPGVTIVTYVVSDPGGNTDTCSFVVTAELNAIPLIECPDDVTVSTSDTACTQVVNDIIFTTLPGSALITDTTYTLSGATVGSGTGDASGETFNLGTTIVTYQVEAPNGTTDTCSFSVTVIDPVVPEINCPADITLIASVDTCGAIANFGLPTASDNCSVDSIYCSVENGAFLPTGANAVTCYAVDGSGNIDSCTFIITVEDTIPPMIVCPNSMIVSSDPDTCGANVQNIDLIASDACGIALYSYEIENGNTTLNGVGDASGSFFELGTSTVTYSAIDNSGNVSTCTFEVVVVDDSAPQLTCPDDTVVSVQSGMLTVQVGDLAPQVDENCGVLDTTYSISNGITGTGVFDTIFGIDTFTVTYIVNDFSGNTDSCSFNLIVNNPNPPKIICPDDTVTTTQAGECFAVIGELQPEIQLPVIAIDTVYYILVDPITGDTIGNGDFNPSMDTTVIDTFPVGTTIGTYFVEDIYGNSNTCGFTVTVLDDEGPILSCPDSNIVLMSDSFSCGIFIDSLFMFEVEDECSGVDTVFYTLTGDTELEGSGFPDSIFFNIGTTVIEVTAIDSSGNESTCSFNVEIEDILPPFLTCPSSDTIIITQDTMLLFGGGGDSCTVEYCIPFPDAADSCGISSTTYSLSGVSSGTGQPGDCVTLNVGITTITYAVSDNSGNISNCSFDVVVIDQIAPTITCPQDGESNVYQPPISVCYFAAELALPDIVDNCGASDVSISYFLTNENGVVFGQGAGAANDTFPVGMNTVTYVVEDLAGNVDSCSFNFTVIDDVAPDVICPPTDTSFSVNGEFLDVKIVDAVPGSCGAPVKGINPGLEDNCTVAQSILDTLYYTFETATDTTSGPWFASGQFFEQGITIVTYYGFDPSGNSDTCRFAVWVRPEQLTLEASPNAILCEGEALALNVGGAVPGATYEWNGPGFNSNLQNPIVTDSALVNQSGMYVVNVEYDSNCVVSDSIMVTVNDAPDIAAAAEPLPCTDGSLDATLQGINNGAGNIVSWIWTNEDEEFIGDSQDIVIPGATSSNQGTYTVTVTNENQCVATAMVSLMISDKPELPRISLDCNNQLCLDESCTLIGTSLTPNIDSLVWTATPMEGSGLPSNPDDNFVEIVPSEPGMFTYGFSVIVDGCESDRATTEVEVLDAPNAETDTVFMGLSDNEVTFNVYDNDNLNGDVTFQIQKNVFPEDGELVDNGDGSFTFIPTEGFIGTAVFSYEICRAECPDLCDFAVVNIIREFSDEDDCIFPNFITPNGDGENDAWNILCLESTTEFPQGRFPDNEVKIYNEWGDMVFDAAPYNNVDSWDGTKDGNKLPDGTYFYIFKRTPDDNDPVKGYIMVISGNN